MNISSNYPPLTERQEQVLDYLRETQDEKGRLHGLLRISRAFGWSGPSAARNHVEALIKKGRLHRDGWGQLRFTNLDRA